MKSRLLWMTCGIFAVCLSLFAQEELPEGVYALFETERGEVVFSLDYLHVPATVGHFLSLSNSEGELTFFKEIDGYALFGGYKAGREAERLFPRETTAFLSHDRPGVLSMMGREGGISSQVFFITERADPQLDARNVAFGTLVSGEEILSKMRRGDRIKSISIENRGEGPQKFGRRVLAADREEGYVKDSDVEALRKNVPHLGAVLDRLGEGVRKSDSGLFYKIEKEGTGPRPKEGQTMVTHYTGTLLDGTKFDSSVDRGTPFELVMKSPMGVIEGWVETLPQMKVGEKRTIVLPPSLAYGSRGAGGIIPPNAWLVFELELLGAR